MIQIEVKQSRAIPGFSCLQMKQELQERVRMSDEEFIEHLRKGAERFDRKMERLQAEEQSVTN